MLTIHYYSFINSKLYIFYTFKPKLTDWVVIGLKRELGIHKPVRYLDFITVRRVVMYNARQYMSSVIQ